MGIHLVCCWPGLAAAWCRGNPRSLVAALLFSWSICLLLLATFVWPQWLGIWLVRAAWVAAAATWLGTTIFSHFSFSRLMGRPDNQSQSTFESAQQEYLRGNWFEAEALLLDLLERFPRDAEALLLLVGVLRHTQRWQPALRRLDLLESLDTSGPWRFEIRRERQMVEQRLAAALSQ